MISLEIAFPDGKAYTGEVASVTLPGVDGEMTVLPGHEPLCVLLQRGTIKADCKDTPIPIEEGVALIMGGSVRISAKRRKHDDNL